MTNKKALSDFKPLQKKMEKDKDPFMFIHFSREENHFKGIISNEMDIGDALIIVKHLISRFDINTQALVSMKLKVAKDLSVCDHIRESDRMECTGSRCFKCGEIIYK